MLYREEILRVMEIESGRKLIGNHVSSSDTNGGFTNDKTDVGGKTNWGWTETTLARLAPTLKVETLTFLEAHDLYYEHFYKASGAELVATYSKSVSMMLFEYAVHRGHIKAAKLLQELLNLNNNLGTLWEELVVDGDVGPATMRCVRAFAERRGNQKGELVFLMQYSAAIINYYRARVTKMPSQEKYYFGWCYRAARDHLRYIKDL